MSTVIPTAPPVSHDAFLAFINFVKADEKKLMLQPEIDFLTALKGSTDLLNDAAQVKLLWDKFVATWPQLLADVKAQLPVRTAILNLFQDAIAKEQAKLAAGV
jgi:hypothetical protein